jgi:hypothetical protein
MQAICPRKANYCSSALRSDSARLRSVQQHAPHSRECRERSCSALAHCCCWRGDSRTGSPSGTRMSANQHARKPQTKLLQVLHSSGDRTFFATLLHSNPWNSINRGNSRQLGLWARVATLLGSGVAPQKGKACPARPNGPAPPDDARTGSLLILGDSRSIGFDSSRLVSRLSLSSLETRY